MSLTEPISRSEDLVAEDEDFGAELSDDDLGDILIREITIDGMCGVY